VPARLGESVENGSREDASMTQPLGVGFLGTGDISILHANAVARSPEARLIGVWNRTAARGRRRAAEFGCRWYDTAEALVADPEIGAVFILTNLETHLQYARLAFGAGKPVLCEKPVAATTGEVREMKRLAEEAGLLCVPGHNMIYEQSVERAHDMIGRGDLGRVVSVYVLYNIYHNEERAAAYPGVVRQIMTHNLYTVRYLGGRPTRVTAFKTTVNHGDPGKEDLAMALLQLESGALAHICANFAADDLSSDPWTFLVKVIGTAGTARYTYQDWVEVKKGIAHSRTYTAYQESICNEVAQFVEILRHGGEPPSTLDDAIACQQALEGIEDSIASGRSVDL
jgi:predicted dehydrogenase